MTSFSGPGWAHEDDTTGETYATAEEALRGWILHTWGTPADDVERDDGIQALTGVHIIRFYKDFILESEAMRDNELIGLDDEEWLLELPIGGKFFKAVSQRRFYVDIFEKDTGIHLDWVELQRLKGTDIWEPIAKPKPVVDPNVPLELKELEAAVATRKRFDDTDILNVKLTYEGVPVEISKEDREGWKYVGLGNSELFKNLITKHLSNLDPEER